MSSFIDRLFTHRASRINQSPSDTDPIKNFFDYLIGQGTPGARLKLIESKLENFEFPEDQYLAEICVASFYLDLEYYLLHHDSRYISTEQKLRQEIKLNFPSIANSDAFAPLYVSGKNQEVIFAQFFLIILLKKFKDEDPELTNTISWLNALTKAFKAPASDDIVKQINTFRRIKDDALRINQEFGELFGQDFVDSAFSGTKEEFLSFYEKIPAVVSINDIIPQLFTSLLHESPQKNFFNTPLEPTEETEEKVDSANTPKTTHVDVLENLLDGYILFDAQGTIKDCNTLSTTIFSLSKKELKGSSIYALLPQDVTSALKSDISSLHQNKLPKLLGNRKEVDLKNKKGSIEPYEISFSNNYSEPVETFSIFIRDITQRNDTLRAKASAERAAEAKSTFLSNMSHEIRTPLNVILGLSELLIKNGLDDKKLLEKNLEGISFSAKNLLSIVDDILDFSKIEAGKLSLQALDFNLKEVLSNLTNTFEIKAREKGLQLITTIDERIPDIIVGDQYRLNQIITNLIGNAIKFTKQGKITLELQLIEETTDEVTINFIVTDTGIGIPKNQLPYIFKSFYQVDEPEHAKINGTGLGLSITHELINLQGGSLFVESEPGKGSSFYFKLNYSKSKRQIIQKLEKHSDTENQSLKGLRVLVAEDNKMNQFYIRQLLQGLNVEADIAENGEEAVAIYTNNKANYDLILMDMHMPVMNGLDAIALIRKSEKNLLKKVPIVACSADVFPEARKNAIKAGIDFYLTKPLKEEALKEVLYWLVSEDTETQKPVPKKDLEDTTPENESTSVDIQNLFEIFDNDKDFVISLLEVFITETPEDLNSLRNCVEREYYPRASTLAHKMKSSFMNLGMTQPGHHLQKIEAYITKPDKLEDAKAHLKAFENLYNKALLDVNLQLIKLKEG